jgi:glycosyltransferase involved in cell wall biosynthesis
MSTRPLTVLQVVPALDSGGVERGTLEVGRELVQCGHRSLVLSGGGRMVAELEADGSRHFCWSVGRKSPLTTRWVLPLRKLLTREKVDVLHVRSRVPAWVAWLAWKSLPKQSRPRFLTTAHGLYSVNRYSEIMARGERVIAISRTVCDYLARSYPGLDQDRVRLIYRGVDPAEFPHGYIPPLDWWRAWHAEFPQLQGRRVVTLPGRLTRLKGHPLFLQLIRRLRQTVPEVHGLIVGGEDPRRQNYAAEIRRQVTELGLDQHVTFTGHRADMREIYAASDVVVSLSSNPPEAFGRTTLEALSVGTPVVGYAHAGIGEILSGVFPEGAVDTGNLDAMAEKLLHILRHGAEVPANTQFTRQRMLDQTLDVYEELAA